VTKPIYVFNASTLVSNADVEAMCQITNYQVQHHIAPAWGRTPVMVFFTSNAKSVPAGSYLITIADDDAQAQSAGVLGYHSEDPGDVTYGRVFAKPVLDNGGDALHKDLSVCSVLSHEVCEAFLDPSCNRWCEDADGTLYALEAADPVENESYVVSAGNVTGTCSDFVLPSWFDPDAKDGDLIDYLGKLTTPFTIAADGYAITMQGGTVSQQFGESYPDWRRESKKSDLARTYKRQHEGVSDGKSE
jgi:hypothetical protein